MIYSIVDVLLGGRRGTAAMRIEGRPYTTIERTLVERLIQVVLADLSASFDPLCPVTFRFERLEVNPRFATISRLSNAAILARLRIDMEDRGGRLELLLPYATLEPVRELLLQQFMGEKFGRDSIWETHLAEELWNTDIELSVVLDEQMMRLSDVIALQPAAASAECGPGGRCGALRRGRAVRGPGRSANNHVAVRIERERAHPRDDERWPGERSWATKGLQGGIVFKQRIILLIFGWHHGGMEWTLESSWWCCSAHAVSRDPAGTRAGRAEARPRRRWKRWWSASTPAPSRPSRHPTAACRGRRRRAADRPPDRSPTR